MFTGESYLNFSHISKDRACGKTTGLMLCICLCVSICLKAAACRGLSREYGDDEQYSAENFRRISRSLSGTIISEREEAPVSSHSFVSRIRICLFRAPPSLLGNKTVLVKEQGETEGCNLGKAMCTQQKRGHTVIILLIHLEPRGVFLFWSSSKRVCFRVP